MSFIKAGKYLGASYLLEGHRDKIVATVTFSGVTMKKTFSTKPAAMSWVFETIEATYEEK